MYLELNLNKCLEEIKRSKQLAIIWCEEILKSAEIMKRTGKAPAEVRSYLKRNFLVLREISRQGFRELMEKPLAIIELRLKGLERKSLQETVEKERRGKIKKIARAFG